MGTVSISDAKNHLPRLVQQVEQGGILRISRRGTPVAVLMSEQEYERLTRSLPSLARLLEVWRASMDSNNVSYVGDVCPEWDGLRDHAERKPVDFE